MATAVAPAHVLAPGNAPGLTEAEAARQRRQGSAEGRSRTAASHGARPATAWDDGIKEVRK
jgi:hypothetical protein